MNIKMIGAALALGLLAGCAAAFAPKAGGDTRSAEKSGAEGGETCTAMYVPLGNGSYILVDQDSGSVFTICVPEQVLDAGGEPMAFEDLRAGNILKITGDGVMLYSYPGQYPGVTQVQLVQEGSPEDAEQYDDHSIDVFLRRVKPYNPNGRNQSEEEAWQLDQKIKSVIPMPYYEYDGDIDGYKKVYDLILKKLEERASK